MKKQCILLSALLMISAVPSVQVHAENERSVTFTELDRTVNDGEPVRGADISSVLALEESGVTFHNNTNYAEEDIFKLLADYGVNYIRVRVWNQPSDSEGHSYGGGNNDVKTAAEIGRRAAQYGMKLLVDFHYSDFWADPEKQRTPKAWKNYSVDEKGSAIYYYTLESLQTIREAGADIGMVQIGNETNGVMCGENDMYEICKMMKAGCNAVKDFDTSVLKVLHFADPSSGQYPWYARVLNECEVNYDVFATSYYPYWHGTTQNLTNVLKSIADTYDKYVMVAETAYPYTSEDGDKFVNVISETSANATFRYEISVDGQAECFMDVFQAVADVGEKGIGAFYWEPAWIGRDIVYGEQVRSWETYGSGWATSYASDYDDSITTAGGSSYDNQALFNFWGYPLDSLEVYSHIYPQKYTYHQQDGAAPVSGVYTLKNQNSRLYLSVDDDGNVIQSETPYEWNLERQSDGYALTLENGQALTIVSGTGDGKNAVRLGKSAQALRFVQNANDTFCLMTTDTLCLDIFDESVSAGAWATYSRAFRSESQQFVLDCLKENNPHVKGDIHRDNIVNLQDILLLHKYLIKKETITKEQWQDSDLNEDGVVNIYDWILLKRQIFRTE